MCGDSVCPICGDDIRNQASMNDHFFNGSCRTVFEENIAYMGALRAHITRTIIRDGAIKKDDILTRFKPTQIH